MKTLLCICILIFCFLNAKAQSEAWAISSDYTAAAVDREGHLLLANGTELQKLDSASGAVLWSQNFAAPIKAIAVAPDNSIYVSGLFTSSITLGAYTLTPANASNLFLVKLNAAGTVQWARQISGSGAFTKIQLATDSRNAVYAGALSTNSSILIDAVPKSGLPARNLFAARFSQFGSFQCLDQVPADLHPYVLDQTAHTFSVDLKDNLHFCFYVSSATLQTGPPANASYMVQAQARAWFDSTGYLKGAENMNGNSSRTWFPGYKAMRDQYNYVTTRIQRGLDGSESYDIGCGLLPADACFNKPPIAPDADESGKRYFAGRFPVLYSSGITCPSASPLPICGKQVKNTGLDIFLKINNDTVISTWNNGYTNEFPNQIIADPRGGSVYILGEWSGIKDTSMFYFGTTILTQPGKFVLRYRMAPPAQPLSIHANDVAVCKGGTVEINTNVSGGVYPYTYSWFPASGLNNYTAANPEATLTATTQYIVTVTDAAGTSATDTLQVTVDPDLYKPVISLRAGFGTNPFCEGDSVTLYADAAVSYNWSNGGSGASIRLGKQDTVFLTAIDARGCMGQSLPYYLIMKPRTATPQIMTSATFICPGQSLVLQASDPEGTVLYNWNTGSSLSNITVNKAGTYSVAAFGSSGCASLPASITIVSSKYAIGNLIKSGPAAFCAGDSLQLTVQAEPGTTVMWNTGETANKIWVKQSGSYFALLQAAGFCPGSTDTVIATVSSKLNPRITLSEDLLKSSPADTYQWYWNGSLLPGAVMSSLPVNQGGVYSVRVGSNGCTDSTSYTYYAMSKTAVVSYVTAPNPASGNLQLHYRLSSDQKVSIFFRSINGARISTIVDGINQAAGAYQFQIPVNNLKRGLYIIEIHVGNQVISHKQLIQ